MMSIVPYRLSCYISVLFFLLFRIDFNFTSLYVVKVDDFFLHYIQKVQYVFSSYTLYTPYTTATLLYKTCLEILFIQSVWNALRRIFGKLLKRVWSALRTCLESY